MAEHSPRPLVAAEAEEAVSQIICARRKRANLLGPQLFSDPAWDMLLALFQAELRQQSLATYELAKVTCVPATTALRWIDVLEREGLLRRRPDPLDARRIFVGLSARGSAAMQQWLQMWLEGHPSSVGSSSITDLLTRIDRS